MKLISAIKAELERDAKKVPIAEMMEFKRAMTDQDRVDYRRELEGLGYEIEPDGAS